MTVRLSKFKKGFTLIELLVVISVISLLSSIIFSGLGTAKAKSRDAKRLSDIKQIQNALELYFNENGKYPVTGWVHSYNASWQNGTHVLATALSPYLAKLPVDPKNDSVSATSGGFTYSYFAASYPSGLGTPGDFSGSGLWYMIVFRLENSSHPLQSVDGSQSCQSGGLHTGTGGFHYGNGSNGIITLGGNCVTTPVNET